MTRTVIVKLDDLARMLQDYISVEDAPTDMQPVRVCVNPAHSGKIGVLVSSESWKGYIGEQLVDFQVKRFYGIGRDPSGRDPSGGSDAGV